MSRPDEPRGIKSVQRAGLDAALPFRWDTPERPRLPCIPTTRWKTTWNEPFLFSCSSSPVFLFFLCFSITSRSGPVERDWWWEEVEAARTRGRWSTNQLPHVGNLSNLISGKKPRSTRGYGSIRLDLPRVGFAKASRHIPVRRHGPVTPIITVAFAQFSRFSLLSSLFSFLFPPFSFLFPRWRERFARASPTSKMVGSGQGVQSMRTWEHQPIPTIHPSPSLFHLHPYLILLSQHGLRRREA